MCDICDGKVPLPSTPPTLEEAITVISHSRQTHVDWAEHLEKNPNPTVEDGKLAAASPQFHRHCIARYDRVLEVLRRYQDDGK